MKQLSFARLGLDKKRFFRKLSLLTFQEGMVLKFVNSFFALYYVAFFKEPGRSGKNEVRSEALHSLGCLFVVIVVDFFLALRATRAHPFLEASDAFQ